MDSDIIDDRDRDDEHGDNAAGYIVLTFFLLIILCVIGGIVYCCIKGQSNRHKVAIVTATNSRNGGNDNHGLELQSYQPYMVGSHQTILGGGGGQHQQASTSHGGFALAPASRSNSDGGTLVAASSSANLQWTGGNGREGALAGQLVLNGSSDDHAKMVYQP
jgi:hypothetical protein